MDEEVTNREADGLDPGVGFLPPLFPRIYLEGIIVAYSVAFQALGRLGFRRRIPGLWELANKNAKCLFRNLRRALFAISASRSPRDFSGTEFRKRETR